MPNFWQFEWAIAKEVNLHSTPFFHLELFIYAHTCKIWISPVSDRTYLNILDMMNSPEKGDSPGHMPT